MTENEIIAKLQHNLKLGDSPIGKGFGTIIDKQLLADTIALIRRQQAEIDKKNELLEYVKTKSEDIQNLVVENRKTIVNIYDAYEREVKTARAEAIKEFAIRLKANRPHLNTGEQVFYIRPEAVDEMVKEMVGECDEAD